MRLKNTFDFFSTVLVVAGVTSCSKVQTASYPYSVEVLALKSVDSLTDKTSFEIVTKELKTLRDLDNLEGDFLQITQGGNLKIKSVNGSLVEPDRFSDGRKPLLRYKVKDGVVVPKDYSTFSMLSTYYQFDFIFSELQSKLGITALDLFKGQANSRFEALYEPKVSIEASDGSADATMKLNASFVPKNWQFVFYRRSAVEQIPIAANLQVIAHEFGHSVFQRYFYDGKYDNESRLQNEYALRGINEGFADFISYVFTGSGDVLRASLDFVNTKSGKEVASYRNFKFNRFSYAEFISSESPQKAKCVGEFYCIGTIFARGLYDIAEALSQAGEFDKKLFAPSVIAALPGILTDIENSPVPEQDPGGAFDFSNPVFDRWIVSQFINGLVKRMPAATQAKVCQTFGAESSFGTTGYPVSLRKLCGVVP